MSQESWNTARDRLVGNLALLKAAENRGVDVVDIGAAIDAVDVAVKLVTEVIRLNNAATEFKAGITRTLDTEMERLKRDLTVRRDYDGRYYYGS